MVLSDILFAQFQKLSVETLNQSALFVENTSFEKILKSVMDTPKKIETRFFCHLLETNRQYRHQKISK